jgi:hypothetical protein
VTLKTLYCLLPTCLSQNLNNDLDKLREKVLAQGKIYSKFPKDPVIRGHYYKLYREYNKLRKKTKHRQFKVKSLTNWILYTIKIQINTGS